MADLTQACANLGLDSRQLRPIAHATDSGRVAVYIGAAWQELPLGKAINLRDQLDRALAELQAANGCIGNVETFRARRADAILANCLEDGGLDPALQWRIRQHLARESLPFPEQEGSSHA